MGSSRLPYLVEEMTLADVPAVAALEKMVFPLPWSKHAFEHELRHNPMAHFLVLRQSGNANSSQERTMQLPSRAERRPHLEPSPYPLLGYGGFWLVVDEAHICTLAVHPDWRGRGLGELLLVHLLERATEVNAAVVTLEVRPSNLVAQSLYGKYGFVMMGVRRGYYCDSGEDAIIMTTDRISSAAFQQLLQERRAALWQKLARHQD